MILRYLTAFLQSTLLSQIFLKYSAPEYDDPSGKRGGLRGKRTAGDVVTASPARPALYK